MLSRAIAAMLPIVPVPIVRRVSKRYIAGETLPEAIDKVRYLNEQGYEATLDLLGEDVTCEDEARQMTDGYVEILDGVAREGVRSNVSVKLTNHGLVLDTAMALRNARRIVEAAEGHGNFVRIDMESSEVTDATLDVFRALREQHENVGIVLQAYLHRTDDDITALAELARVAPPHSIDVRICKGIYREPRAIASRRKRVIRESFLRHTKAMIEAGIYVGIATHDKKLMEPLAAWLDERGIAKDSYEFQALLGVPVTDVLNRFVQEGRKVRLYVPFGSNSYGYAVRRLRENPKMAGHVFKAMFKRTRYED